MKIPIPNSKTVELKTLILDLNGTLTVHGKLVIGVAGKLNILKKRGLKIVLFSGDTRGNAKKITDKLGIAMIKALSGKEKRLAALKLNPMTCVAIGNGLIDKLLFQTVKLSIATLQAEGVHMKTIAEADIIVLFLFLIYLISFIIFSLHTSGVWFLPSFGFQSIGILFSSLPWWLIIISIGLIIVLELFAERLSFVHHRPVVYSLAVIVVIVILASVFIAMTPFHSNLFESAYDQHLPVIGSFYRDYGAPRIDNVHNGVVTKLTSNGAVIETPNDEMLTVIFDTNDITSLLPTLKVSNALVVVGQENGNTIQASLVRKIQEDMNLFPSHRLHSHSL